MDSTRCPIRFRSLKPQHFRLYRYLDSCHSSTVASKVLTREQAQARKDAAVRFAENVLGDSDKADDIESEGLDDWVERKRITLIDNPRRNSSMANGNGDPRTKAELLDEIDQLQQENQDLQDALDAVADIVTGGPPEDEDEDDDDSD